ncbi:hypothetical protein SB758_40100, partial [Burkholderia sp. SIMBA_013]
IRFLSMDAVQKANSGHPGAPIRRATHCETIFLSGRKWNATYPQCLPGSVGIGISVSETSFGRFR